MIFIDTEKKMIRGRIDIKLYKVFKEIIKIKEVSIQQVIYDSIKEYVINNIELISKNK